MIVFPNPTEFVPSVIVISLFELYSLAKTNKLLADGPAPPVKFAHHIWLKSKPPNASCFIQALKLTGFFPKL